MLNLNGNSITSDTGQALLTNYRSTDSASGKEDVSVNNTRNATNIHDGNLSDLKVGDVFSGEILNINKHEVSIRLNDNSVVNALLKQSFQLNIGQQVVFQVKDKMEGQIFIRPLADETVSSELVNKSLYAAGLTVNDKNSLIVSTLIEQAQPIDRQTVIHYMKLSNQYGIENLVKLIDMEKQGIQINSENLEMYDKYVNSSHQISDMIGTIPDKMTGYLENLIQDGVDKNMPEIYKFLQMLHVLSDVIDTVENTVEEKLNPEDTQISQNERMTEETQSTADKTMVSDGKNPVEDITTGGKYSVEDIASDGKSSMRETADVRNLAEEPMTAEQKGPLNETWISGDKFPANETMDGKPVAGKKSTVDMENAGENKTYDTLKQIARDISAIIRDGDGTGHTEKKLDLSVIRERIKDIFHDKLMLDISNDSKTELTKQQVDRLYEKLMKSADIIKDYVPAQKDNELNTGANELKNNLNFMNELNQLESYVQLPVKFSAEDVNGDLYVYNRKKGRKKTDEPLTAFLHLELMYLGVTDVNVSLKNRGVKIGFTLDNMEAEELVLEHLGELADRLRDKGYSAVIDAELVKQETETGKNALLPITTHNENVISIKRYTLDVRT